MKKNVMIAVVIVIVIVAAAGLMLIGSPLTTEAVKITTSTTQPAGNGNVKEFTVLMTHAGGYSFNPGGTTIIVNKGDTVKILATSEPVSHKHGITIDEYGINVAVTAGPLDPPQEISFVADKAGTFKIWCKTCEDPDGWGPHPWMIATLIVQ